MHPNNFGGPPDLQPPHQVQRQPEPNVPFHQQQHRQPLPPHGSSAAPPPPVMMYPPRLFPPHDRGYNECDVAMRPAMADPRYLAARQPAPFIPSDAQATGSQQHSVSEQLRLHVQRGREELRQALESHAKSGIVDATGQLVASLADAHADILQNLGKVNIDRADRFEDSVSNFVRRTNQVAALLHIAVDGLPDLRWFDDAIGPQRTLVESLSHEAQYLASEGV